MAFRKAVITGVGIVSPYGVGASYFFESLRSSNIGVKQITAFDIENFPVKVAGQVSAIKTDLNWITQQNKFMELSKKQLEIMANFSESGYFQDRKLCFALLAALEAVSSAGLNLNIQKPWLSIGLGLEQAFLKDFENYYEEKNINWNKIKNPESKLKNKILFRSEVDLSARALAAFFDLNTPSIINASACAAGTMSVAQAAQWVERGMTDLVICGASDSMINPLGLGGMSKLGATSQINTSEACKPFDRHRDGLVIGEGAAFFIVEEITHAKQRKTQILAQISGSGVTQDGYGITAPDPSGHQASIAMSKAIERAQIKLKDIGYINAHGTGTLLNDPAEAKALHKVFQEHANKIPVSSIKGHIGHLMAAAGAIEIASCLLPFQCNFLPGTKNLSAPDPSCDLDVIFPKGIDRKVNHVMTNSFGFGGQNASMILSRWRND